MSDNYFEEEEFTTQFNGRTIVRILSQMRPHWKWTLGFFCSILYVSILDAYFTFLSKRIIDEGILAKNYGALLNLTLVYGALIIIQSFGVFAFIFLTGILGERIRYDLRKKLFNKLQDLSLSYYSRTPVGWIMSRVTSDTERVSDLVTWGLLDSSWAIANILSSAYFMLQINWRLAVSVLFLLPVLVWVAVEFRKRILVEFRLSRKFNSKITGAYNENITGVRVVKALGREDENLQEFSQLSSKMYQASYRAAWLSALFLPTVQILSAFALGAIAWYGGFQYKAGLLTIGGIQAFISYITFMMWPIQDLARVYSEMQHSVASAERMFSLLDSVPEIQDRRGAIELKTLMADLEFDHVDFYYDEDDEPVLSDFSLKVRKGEKIALVGPTGGGKTTIVNLLCRFYEPRRGVIRIGGRDYTDFTLKSLQSRIGIVLQTPHLFSGSVRENIRYGSLAASDEEVEQAAKMAGAHEFIINLEKGYETEVGEGGNLLSTGQKQLISLARAVLAKPELFIMDEATSSVDTITETLIQKGMDHLMQGRTSFIVAHRLSTIRRADRILVIEGGKITEMGSHAELVRKRGRYYRLYTQQFRQELSQEYKLLEFSGVAAD